MRFSDYPATLIPFGTFMKKIDPYTPFAKRKIIRWKVVAGEDDLDYYQSYDLILCPHDLKQRHMDEKSNFRKDKHWKQNLV